MGLNRDLTRANQDLYDIFVTRSNTIGHLVKSLHPRRLSKLIEIKRGKSVFDYDALEVLHGSLFDPAWLCNDDHIERAQPTFVCKFGEFTAKKFMEKRDFDIERFFPGAFAYHLHLSVFGKLSFLGYEILGEKLRISEDSYFSYFEDYFRTTLKLSSDVK